jgi:Indole-3-glycerol phosphate synthase
MNNFLETILESTRRRVLQATAPCLNGVPNVPSFKDALLRDGVSVIAEVKKASPSKGVIAPEFPYLEIAKEYEAAGAAAISVLTEPSYFMGDPRYLIDIKKEVALPLLRKDFIIDKIQIDEAHAWGASAVLLIKAALPLAEFAGLYAYAKSLGLDVLCEVHDERELEAVLDIGVDIIGINNRNLATFEVDIDTTKRLSEIIRRRHGQSVTVVGESGIVTAGDVKRLGDVDAVLVGETLMRSSDKAGKIRELCLR